jgi:hypothetical protein
VDSAKWNEAETTELKPVARIVWVARLRLDSEAQWVLWLRKVKCGI